MNTCCICEKQKVCREEFADQTRSFALQPLLTLAIGQELSSRSFQFPASQMIAAFFSLSLRIDPHSLSSREVYPAPTISFMPNPDYNLHA